MSIDPAELQKLLEERDKSRASSRRAWENLTEIRWVLTDTCGIELLPPAQKTIDLEGRIVKDGVKLECANTLFSDEEFSFEVPIISGRWSGKVSPERPDPPRRMEAMGRFRKPGTFAAVLCPWALRPLTMNLRSRRSMSLGLKVVLDRDLANVLEHGILAASAGIGVSIGAVKYGVRRVLTYGMGSRTRSLKSGLKEVPIQIDSLSRAENPEEFVKKPIRNVAGSGASCSAR